MNEYQYQSLASGGEDGVNIRLVVLPPGPATEEITCSVIHAPLDESPKFEALSYTWGDPNDKESILCDGKILPIPRTVIPFLQQIRAKGDERTFWIDSICINQHDELEKASQVQKMREIFERAVRTFIWLGPATEDSNLGLDFAVRLSRLSANVDKQTMIDRMKQFFAFDLRNPLNRQWYALFRILDRPWFNRVWVIQELVVSNENWLMCGDRTIRWETYTRAVFYIFIYKLWLFEFLIGVNIGKMVDLIFSRLQYQNKRQEKHYYIMLRHRRNLARNPLDTCFAFYGMTCRRDLEDDRIRPKYPERKKYMSDEEYEVVVNRATQDLFIHLATATLLKENCLDILSVPRLPSCGNEITLPSWVPNWSASEPICFSLMQFEQMNIAPDKPEETPAYRYFQATTNSKCPDLIIVDNKLRVSGYVIDSIEELGETWRLAQPSNIYSLHDQAEVLQFNQNLIYDAMRVFQTPPKGSSKPKYSYRDIVHHICVGGFYPDSEASTRAACLQWEKRQRVLRVFYRLGLHKFIWTYVIFTVIERVLVFFGYRNPEMPFRAQTSALLFRKAMRTADGKLGLAPGLAEKGDKIMLLKGGRLPFILREREKGWELIGDTYVYGAMKGELWDEKNCEQIWIQ
jgi:hypothetical protein